MMDLLPPKSGDASTFGSLCRSSRRRIHHAPRRDVPPISPAKAAAIGLPLACLLVIGTAVFSTITTGMNFDGGFAPASYEFAVTDEFGRPLDGVELEVTGPTRRVRTSALNPSGGTWPIYEAGRDKLTTNERGELRVHQPERGLQYGWHSSYLFWVIPTGDGRPEFACVFRKAGFKARTIDFDSINERAMAVRYSAETRVGPGGFSYPIVHIDVVMMRD